MSKTFTDANGKKVNVQQEMPIYQSHKKVWALKIKDVRPMNGAFILTPSDSTYGSFPVNGEWISRYNPEDSDKGYYVVYKGGYASWSPSEAFEEGYKELNT